MNLTRILLLVMLYSVQTGHAMQLGASKGSVVFGRPLDLTIPVRFDTAVEDPFNCFSAEVFQADAKFDAGRVRVDVTPASNGLDALVRIRSSTAVIEPWAKVILRNNCGAKVTRQYDFLTDFVADMPAINTQTESVASNNLPITTIVDSTLTKQNTQTATVSNALPLLPSAPVSNWSVKRAQATSQVNPQTTNQTTAQAPTKTRRTEKPNIVEPKQTAMAAAPASSLGKAAQIGQSRLKMETFELTDENQVLLKLSSAMIAPTGMRTPEEIQALAQATAVWRAINGMPALATAASTVAEAALVNTSPAATLQTKAPAMVKDGKYEFSNPIVYGLLGLLALTLACIAWLGLKVRRSRQQGYGWLEEAPQAERVVQTEPSQYIQTSLNETAFVPKEELVEEAQEFANAELEAPHVQLAEAAFDPNPLAVLLSNKKNAALNRNEENKKVKTKKQDHQEFSVANAPERSPAHFEDSRFDKQQLITKFNTSLVQEDIANSLGESVDFVVPDTIPKLRSVLNPVINPVMPVDSETEIENRPAQAQKATAESKQFSTNLPKKELRKDISKEPAAASKGNLIDFEVFADPAPLPKPSRFAR